MKKIILIMSLLLSLNSFAQSPVFTCTYSVDFHNGHSETEEFQIPIFNDYSAIAWGYSEGYTITIKHEAREENISEFKLKITKENALLFEKDIEPSNEITYKSANLSYLLLCK